MVKELIAGAGIGAIIFLAWTGIDVTPVIVLGGVGVLVYLLMEKKGLGVTQVGNSYQPQKKVAFEDIGGQAVAKQELQEALQFILRAVEVEQMGIRPLKGILLNGPPGTGKTLLAKAAANYTQSVFFEASGSEFIEMYAGVGAQRVRALFRKARELARKEKKRSAVIFIDELEVLGGKRGRHASHMEYDQTLNQLLVEMDGITEHEGVQILVLGATNRPDILDPALLRPGRFDRHVQVELPGKLDRLEILRLHMANKPLDAGGNLETIAADAFGFSGAQLESLTNEAAILALREGTSKIGQRHLVDALEKVMLGEKAPRQSSEDERRRIAVHEAGHALISELVDPGSVAHVTITSRGKAMGYMRRSPGEESNFYTCRQLEQMIQIAMAGAGSEELLLGCRSTGAVGDLREAVRIARQLIFAGMSSLGVIGEEEITRDALEHEVRKLIEVEDKKVGTALQQYRQQLNLVVDKLLTDERLDGDRLRQILQLTGNVNRLEVS